MQVEFILIGIGINEGTVKGSECPQSPEDCPKGAPTFRFDDDLDYAHDGYKKIQGPANPIALGGRRFSIEKDAHDWLATNDGIRFKRIFLNVFIARVVAD